MRSIVIGAAQMGAIQKAETRPEVVAREHLRGETVGVLA